MNSDRSFILVIVLALIGAVIVGAIVVVSLTRPAAESAETTEAVAESTAEATEEATVEGEAVSEATAEAAAEETSEMTAEATAEATEEAAEPESGDTTAGSDGDESDSGAATPTSLSRVTASIFIGTQSTMMPVSTVAATQPAQTGGESGQPTPTSISRVTQSVILGAAPPQQATSQPQQEAEAETTEEATEEATAEATDESAAGVVGGQGSGSDENRPLPTPVTGRPNESPSALQPRGPVAQNTAAQWWLMLALATVIYAYVMVILLMTVFRKEPTVTEEQDSPARQRNFIALHGFAVPIIVLTIIFAFTLSVLADYSGQTTDLTVEVTGHQWWWEVRYPDHEVVTANEIHVPAGQRVRFNLTSADVIHSFWVPQLGGKMDLIPGQTNTMWLQADEPGVYRGQCAEFCGVQHANMAMLIIADSPSDFNAWIEQQRQPAIQPADALASSGQQVFMNGQCAACHTIQGMDAVGIQGPDLTHLASRRTLAAATLPNTTGHLAGWIVDSQGIKPGNLMPPMDVTGADLQALLAFLGSLH